MVTYPPRSSSASGRLPCAEHGLGVEAAPVTRVCPLCFGEQLAAAGWATRLLPPEQLAERGLTRPPEPPPPPEQPREEQADNARPGPLPRMPRWYAQRCEAWTRAIRRGQMTEDEATFYLDFWHGLALDEMLGRTRGAEP